MDCDGLRHAVRGAANLRYFFEGYVVDTDRRELRRGTTPIAVAPQVFDLLEYLICNRERVVSRDDLIASIWDGRIVSESALSTRINAVRSAIGDSGEDQRLIKTLPRRGYRFTGPVVTKHRDDGVDTTTVAASDAAVSPPSGIIARAPQAERRQLTIMSCELIGSAALSGPIDLEDLRDVVDAYHRCVADTAGRFLGFVAKRTGNVALVGFGYPAAHEDDAERAVLAGLELCVEVRTLSTQTNAAWQCRVGIATGLVIVSDSADLGGRERELVGEVLNLSGRLQEIADPSTVVIADDTRKLLGSLFELQDLGAKDLKGIAGPVRAWSALRASSVESRFEALRAGDLTELVGREEEVELLLRRWSKAKSGAGQAVLLTGEAGIGKSRLAATLLKHLASEPHTPLRYFCSPQHTDSAFYPIIGQLERAAGLAREDTTQAKLDKLDAVLARSSASAQDAALIAEMLSLPNDGRYPELDLTPQQRRQKTLEALIGQMAALARQRPLLVIFEDAHWADPTTLEAFDRVADRIRNLRVLLIVTFRPEFQSSWIGRSHVAAVTLNRLVERDIDAMIDRLAGNKQLPANIRQDIIERTDGIPLFVEEMTKAVLEAESEQAAERIVAAVPSPARAVPASLHASLMARLDRLGPAKEVAQVGAAIGREFSYALLAAVVRSPEADLGSALDRLIAAGLLFRQGLPPNATYLFKHALVQDAAYGTLLREPRRALHAQIAETLESQFAEIAENQPELLARHLAEAGQTRPAIAAWHRAGEGALLRAAYVEATEHLGKAIELSENLPPGPAERLLRFQLQIGHGNALIPSRGYGAPETAHAFARAAELAAGIEDAATRFPARYGLWVGSLVRGEPEPIRVLSAEFLRDAERQPGSVEVLIGHRIVGASRWYDGDYIDARTHLELALAAFKAEEHRPLAFRYGQDVGVAGMIFLALTLWPLGKIESANRVAADAVAYAPNTKHLATVAYALTHTCLLELLSRDPVKLLVHGESLEAVSRELGLRFWFGYASFARGYTRLRAGNTGSGAAEMRNGLDMLHEQGIAWCVPLLQSVYAEAESELGQSESALATINEAIAFGEHTGQRWIEAELHRVRGDILLRITGPDFAAAETSLKHAIEIARHQQTKTFELRGAVALARLWRDQGKRNEARDLLAPVYNWFSEGFDKLELTEAKTLLDTLTSQPPT
jgi:class 3 adenylate cyclase/predicted ATPase